jgi:hypothetical protein
LTTRVFGSPGVAEGDAVAVEFDLSRAHLFHQATGRTLAHGRADG